MLELFATTPLPLPLQAAEQTTKPTPRDQMLRFVDIAIGVTDSELPTMPRNFKT